MDSDSAHKAVRIVDILEDGRKQVKYKLKFKVFKEIFDAVRDKRLAIISIAGAHRSGKSFMMTLLADYLLKNPSEKWGSREQEKLSQVFEHKGGTFGHTKGIYVTRKPFMLKTKDEKEVAVFLMDTQGMFDNKTTANDNSVIFAWSTLLSSVQIYNIDKIIKEDNLQHLQLFTNYAQCVANKKCNVSTSSEEIPSNHPFQELLFLCRNWEYPDYDIGFKGGLKHLKEVMGDDNEENKLVRQRLKDSFSDVCCSLIPPPGKPVTNRRIKDNKPICFSDMDKDFSLEVEALAKYLFGKEHLVAKKLNGLELTGEGLIELAREYERIFVSGQMPKIELLVKSNEKVEFLLTVKNIESNYKKSMQTKMGERPSVPAEFKATHLQCLNEAKDLFHEANILDDEAERLKYLAEMERNIGIIYQSLSKDNKAKIVRFNTILNDHIIYAGRVYYESLEEFAADCWVEDTWKAKDLATRKANESLQARMSDLEKQWFDENKRKDLQMNFESKQEQFEKRNAARKGELHVHMSQLSMQAINIYQDDMEVKSMDDDLENVRENAKKKYLQHIQAMDQYVVKTELESLHVEAEKMAMEVVNSVSYRGDHFLRKCKEKVAELIHFEKQHWVSRNDLLKITEESRLIDERKSLEEQYESEFTEFQDTYIVDEELQKKHTAARDRAMAGLSNNKTKHTAALKTNREELDKNLNESFQMVKQINAENRGLICDKLYPFQSQLQADYCEKMYEVTRKRYADINDLKNMHGSFKAAVVREVEPLIPFPDILKETIQSSFVKLDEKFVKVKAGNTAWNAFKDTAKDIIEAGVYVGKTALGLPGALVAAPVAGIIGGVGGVINLLREVDEKIDVSELQSIIYLKDLKLVAN